MSVANSKAVVLSTALSSGLSAANASIVAVSSGLSTANSRAVVLSTALSSGLSAANASIVEVSSGLSTANSNAVVLSTAVSTGLSAANASIVAVSTGLSTANSTAVVLSSALSSGLAAANASILAVSTGLSSTKSTAVVLSSALSSGLSQANASILVTNASVGLLSSSLSLEISRAMFKETSLASSISTINAFTLTISSQLSLVEVDNDIQELSIIGLSTGLSTTNSTAVMLSTNVSSLRSSLSIVQRQIVKSKVVPINSSTIQSDDGFLEPMYLATYPISSGNPVDGWWYSKTSGTGSIAWTTSLSCPVYFGVNLAQISFTCYMSLNPTSVDNVPYLALPFINSATGDNMLLAFAVDASTNFTGAGEYTFIANLNGNSPGVTYFGDKTIPLVYNSAYSLNKSGGAVPATFNLSNYNASYIQKFQVATLPNSSNINMVVENLQVEIINGGGPVIESGTYQFLFSSSAVNQKYLHNATNYLYSYFFQKPMLSIVEYNS